MRHNAAGEDFAMGFFVDLTHVIEPEMSVFPGDPAPQTETLATCEKDGYRLTKLTVGSHCGTHADAPAQVFSGGRTLDRFPAEFFMGSAMIIDCRGVSVITTETLETAAPFLKAVDFLLFRTGWSAYWRTPQYESGYPVLSDEAADYIARSGCKGVGFDTLGPDAPDDVTLKNHRKLLASGRRILIENLNRLGGCPGGVFHFAAFPLLWKNADAAPVRAVAW